MDRKNERHVRPALPAIAVHIGARVVAAAKPGEVLVSSTVKDLVARSGLQFIDRGLQVLRGVPDEWRLFAVEERIANLTKVRVD
jgi:class 3 adenylate cyclase